MHAQYCRSGVQSQDNVLPAIHSTRLKRTWSARNTKRFIYSIQGYLFLLASSCKSVRSGCGVQPRPGPSLAAPILKELHDLPRVRGLVLGRNQAQRLKCQYTRAAVLVIQKCHDRLDQGGWWVATLLASHGYQQARTSSLTDPNFACK